MSVKTEARTAVLSVRVSPQAKYILSKYAAEHRVHMYSLIEAIAKCLAENPKKSLEECLSLAK